MTSCPSCGMPGAYVGVLTVDCVNHACEHYSAEWAAQTVPAGPETKPVVLTRYVREAAHLTATYAPSTWSTSPPGNVTLPFRWAEIALDEEC